MFTAFFYVKKLCVMFQEFIYSFLLRNIITIVAKCNLTPIKEVTGIEEKATRKKLSKTPS